MTQHLAPSISAPYQPILKAGKGPGMFITAAVRRTRTDKKH